MVKALHIRFCMQVPTGFFILGCMAILPNPDLNFGGTGVYRTSVHQSDVFRVVTWNGGNKSSRGVYMHQGG